MDPYIELGVSPNASAAEISAAGKHHARKHHPDHGGDRDAFDRGRRALVILRDPGKREHYDRTGEFDDQPENVVFSQAINILTQKLSAILGNDTFNPDTMDIMVTIRAQLNDDKSRIRVLVSDHERQIKRLEKFGRRLKMKAVGKENVLVAAVHAQIGAHRQAMAVGQKQMEVADFALEILKDYIYEIDPSQAPAPRRPGSWILEF